jgi:PAS domain S-box-containing protein
MERMQQTQFQYILDSLSLGAAILEATSLRIIYLNPYIHRLVQEAWGGQEMLGRHIDEVFPAAISQQLVPLFRHVAATGESIRQQEIPFEGFLEARGRTYWRISIERSPWGADRTATSETVEQQGDEVSYALFVTVEDVTDTVRSHLHLKAIHHISSAIAGAYALPQVLDHILQAMHELVGSRRCAILLLDDIGTIQGERPFGHEENTTSTTETRPRRATVAAQKGIHLSSCDWHPQLGEQILLGRVAHEQHPLIITDTRAYPDLELPMLDDQGTPRRPGSVLCVPIFEPYLPKGVNENPAQAFHLHTAAGFSGKTLLGTIEVYHVRSRGFPAEEVQLLEQFAQQAALAIQNVRLFRRIEQWARVANRNAHQRKNVMQAIPDGVVIYDPRWRIADANSAARQLFGWSDAVIGQSLAEVMKQSPTLFPEAITLSPHPISKLEQRARYGQTDEFKLVAANGHHYTMRCSYTPVRDELGDTFAFIVIYHNVTEQVAARERIEAEVVARTAELAQRNSALELAKRIQELQQARLELLLERLPSGVMLVSAETMAITIINRRAVQMLQLMGVPLYPLDDLAAAASATVGMNAERLIRPTASYGPSGAVVPYEERPLYLALKGKATEAELHMPGREGQMLYMLVNAAPLRANDGTITNVVLVMHDITTIKTLERAREDFFTTMAHELKTPLANIRAHLSALLARDLQWSGEEQRDFLQTADEQVERLVGMINHFLDASRVEAGALRLEREPLLLPEMFEDLQERLEALITTSNRQLHISLPDQLPAVVGDYELIMSVLTNLLSNAFRYAPEEDTVYLEAELESAGQGTPEQVTLRVTDHGPGMTQEQQAELFTRFSTFAAMSRPDVNRPGQPAVERRRGSTRWSPATGLGLYISRGIIEAHGSTLDLKSSPGQGASFSFTLPVFKEQQEQNNTFDQAASV